MRSRKNPNPSGPFLMMSGTDPGSQQHRSPGPTAHAIPAWGETQVGSSKTKHQGQRPTLYQPGARPQGKPAIEPKGQRPDPSLNPIDTARRPSVLPHHRRNLNPRRPPRRQQPRRRQSRGLLPSHVSHPNPPNHRRGCPISHGASCREIWDPQIPPNRCSCFSFCPS